ncbi:energy-converting hydrogenase A subunit D [Methanofervidicoccus abyssi]|uniref:Energy-converting hydrogenase A subunit D n=1 Tax=Methanofervidicoccus abyssi TaxID=2082189 RepID=A0A401HS12_9EURY|nr:energy-converting hydrogenase A subunit D [Methanofervidicoccus abyssi]
MKDNGDNVELLPLVSIFCVVMGCIGVILNTDYLDKIIMLEFLTGGLIGLIVSFYYLDVATLTSIMEPVSTIILLLGSLKYIYIKRSKKKYSSKLPILVK